MRLQKIVGVAYLDCPYSNMTRANIEGEIPVV
jgi:organic hydroperoxide reductase OsmC/OhrA